MKQVVIYTDGACSGNPGPGGWGCILMYNGHQVEMSGYEPDTTNNRMELTAAIRALERLREPCFVDLYSDSSYLINAFNQYWLKNWVRRNWIKADGKSPVENKDLWKQLYDLSTTHKISWHHVKGHANNEHNNRCDELATGEIKKSRG